MHHALDRLAHARVLVLGDLMADRYQWGEVERISPEAPVPVVRLQREEMRMGGAANVAGNLRSLGCEVAVAGMVGEDATGDELLALLNGLGVRHDGVVRVAERPTTEKIRIMVHNQQMLRCDREESRPAPEAVTRQVMDYVRRELAHYDGIIVSDYGKGLASRGLMTELTEFARAQGKPLVVDPKGLDFSKYRGVTAITPNEAEATQATRITIHDDDDALRAGREILGDLNLDHVCITRGPKGVMAVAPGRTHRMFAAQAREVYDVTGAGDTFISVFGGMLLSGEPFLEAVELANVAAGIVVAKVGTAWVTPTELRQALDGTPKLYTADDIAPVAEDLRRRGKTVVFTNGCFDLLHAGHIQYLQESARQGDVLVVGLNSDDSVRRLKGEGRPVIGETDRAHLLGALACVDYVVVFDEDTPLELIRAVKPHVLTKGADYTVDTVVGHELVAEWGGEVRLIDLKEDRSTSGLIDKIRAGA